MELLAPNGKPSNLNEVQYHLVRTPEFKAWFGDWENSPETSSKVVDSNGEPLVVYHGTKSDIFHEFNSKLTLYRSYRKNRNHFADNIEVAKSYGKNVIAVFLKIKKPKILDYEGVDYTGKAWGRVMGNYGTDFNPKFIKGVNKSILFSNKGELIKRAIELGYNEDDIWIEYDPQFQDDINDVAETIENISYYDGIIAKNIIDISIHKSHIVNPIANQYIVFNTKKIKIKLADGSNTTFDGNNPDIRFELGGTTMRKPKSSILLAQNGKPSNLTSEQYRLVRTPAFKKWFGDWENSPETASKIIDDNGEPLICFHGSNQIFNEFSHEAIGSSNDMGFYGRGFYFTFQKEEKWMKFASGEAGYYGKIVKPYFIKALNPFIFGDLKKYKGVSINFIGTQSLVFLSNIAKKFPQLAEKITLDKKIYNSITKENEITQVPISILPDLIDKYSKDLKIIEVHDNRGETKINGYLKSKTKEVFYDNTESGGTKGSYVNFDTLSYGIDSNNKKESTEILLIEAALEKYDGIEVKYNPEGYMTRNPEITEEIKKNHDCIMQGETGDELVVFENNRMKLADTTNTTFEGGNPDVRFKDGGNVSKLPKEFNSNENLNKEDMPYSLIKELGELGIYEYTEKVSYKKRGNFNDGNKSFYKNIKKYAVFKIQNGELKKIRTNINKKSEAVKILKDNNNSNIKYELGGKMPNSEIIKNLSFVEEKLNQKKLTPSQILYLASLLDFGHHDIEFSGFSDKKITNFYIKRNELRRRIEEIAKPIRKGYVGYLDEEEAYHFTNMGSLFHIIEGGSINTTNNNLSITTNFLLGEKGTSTVRNYRGMGSNAEKFSDLPVKLVLDMDKLKKEAVFNTGKWSGGTHFGEYEFVVSGFKKPFPYYIKRIEIDKNEMDESGILNYPLSIYKDYKYSSKSKPITISFKDQVKKLNIPIIERKRIDVKEYLFGENSKNIRYEDGGQLKDLLSSQEVEDKLGRELHWWNDDIVYLSGIKYKKVYLRPEYKRVIE